MLTPLVEADKKRKLGKILITEKPKLFNPSHNPGGMLSPNQLQLMKALTL